MSTGDLIKRMRNAVDWQKGVMPSVVNGWADELEQAEREAVGQGGGQFESRFSVNLYRSLERLSIAIEECAKIGFEESSPTRNEQHASIWNDLNDAQADAKLKLKAYRNGVTAPRPEASTREALERFDYRGFATKALRTPGFNRGWIQEHYVAALDHVEAVMREAVEAALAAQPEQEKP